MRRLLDNVLAIVILVSPVILMMLGFWFMGLTNYEVENINYVAGIPLVVIGMAGCIGSIEYITDIINESIDE